jgi:hypothetical protein
VTAPNTCTSFTSALVSAAAAILASKDNPENAEDVEAIRNAIVESGNTKPAAEGGWDDESGDGFKEPLLDVGDEELFNPGTVSGTDPSPVDSDVDGDGHSDLVTLHPNGIISVYPGDSDAKFGSEVTSFTDGEGGGMLNPAQYDGEGHYVVDVADVDGDKRSDLVTLTDDGDMHVFAGEEGAGFDEEGATSELGLAPGLLAPGGHEPVAVADVNGDSRGDLVAYEEAAERVMVFPGGSDRIFGSGIAARTDIASALHSGLGHHFVDAADVNGDARADLVAMDSDGDLEVFAGTALGAFADPTASHEGQIDPAMDNGSGQEPVGLGDVTGDDRADLLLIDSSGAPRLYPGQNFHPGQTSGSFGSAVAGSLGAFSTTFNSESGLLEFLGLMDVNGDGRADAPLNWPSNEEAVYVAPGKSDGTFGEVVASEGAFPSTQHFKNQDASGNEFVFEKPSWRRRGCDPRGCGWVIEPTPNGVGADNNRFSDVSCVSEDFCIATANLLNGSSWSYTYTEIWNGEEWSVIAKTPDNTRVHLSGVSCTSSSNCVAVGHHTDESGEEITTLAWRYDGKKWIEQYTPNVDESNNELVGVSCTSTCAAVGSYTDGEDFWTLAQMRR